MSWQDGFYDNQAGKAMVIKHDNGRSIVQLPAVFSHSVTGEFLREVKGELEQGAASLYLDFKDTGLIDSAAIGTLVSIAKDCRSNGARLTLCNLNTDIKDLFIQTGFDKIFTIESKEGVHTADSDIFENSVDIRLYIEKQQSGDVCILQLSGVMNNPHGSQYFKQEFLLALAQYKKIIVDFKELTFFDSLSVSVLLNMNRLIKETGGFMRLCGPNEFVEDLFQTLNIRQVVPFYRTREEALKDWQ